MSTALRRLATALAGEAVPAAARTAPAAEPEARHGLRLKRRR